MSYRSNYVPKKKRVNYKIVVPFLLVLAFGIVYLINNFLPSKQVPSEAFTICKLEPEQSQKLIRNGFSDDTVTLGDYGYYAQSLGVYKETFTLGKADPFNGRTVFLKNVCTEEEQIFMMGLELDGKIPLERLEPGFYEIQILDGFTRSRLIAPDDKTIDDVFRTVSLNNESREVRLVANQNLFDDGDKQVLDKPYVFLDVKQVETPQEQFDVIIDPYGLLEDDAGYLNMGINYKDYIEADQMFELATGIQTELETRGYRVKLSRTKDDSKNYHGVNGRIHGGYLVDAKYFVQLNVDYSSDAHAVGSTVRYSNYSTSRFALGIAKELSALTSLKATDYDNGHPGFDTTGLDGVYDFNSYIREAGGRFTGAGSINKTYQELNSFASSMNRGMNSVLVELGNVHDEQTYQTLMQEKPQIIEAMVNAIAAELGSK